MDYIKAYEFWLNSPLIDKETKAELISIKDDIKEIEDRFYKSLEFGTAGLRGKLGAGTNRMNRYNVAQTTQGIADYIIKNGKERMARGVTIAYDCRHFSAEFAKLAALIFAGNGIKAYLFKSLRPTPELSYTLRKLNATAGIIITASHNPKDYNGYKVYWDDGAQVLPDIANGMVKMIHAVDIFGGAIKMDESEAIKKGLLVMLGEKEDTDYIEMVKSLKIRDDEVDKDIKIVYTPLNGAGSMAVKRVLKERGFNHVFVVPEQEHPDPNFTTIDYPNPEDIRAFEYSIRLGEKVGADLLVATDPDSDRLAIEVKDKNGEYIPFTGNQTGVILIKYIVDGMIEKGTMPKKPAIVKSIVTGNLAKQIAEDHGVEMFDALTGFKNICGRIPELEEKGYTFIFGYEESIGYTIGTAVRDKDGVSAAMMLCEAAGYYKKQGKTLIDILEEVYQTYGYYKEKIFSLVLDGVEGKRRIGRMMAAYRKKPLDRFDTLSLSETVDYLNGYQDIPPTNALKFFLSDGSWYAIRPSGTEPKIKVYIYTSSDSHEASENRIKMIEEKIRDYLDSIK